MKKEHKKLLDQIIKGLDWDSILEVHKAFKIGVGGGSIAIPRLKRKPFSEDLKIEDLKNELKSIVKYMIDKDIAEVQYGSWIIYWTSDEWLFDTNIDINIEGEDLEDMDEEEIEEIKAEVLEDINRFGEATLEVMFAPQRMVISSGPIERVLTELEDDDLTMGELEYLLEEAVSKEDYEEASKIKEIIEKKTNPKDI
jgi:hypothetical protein